MEIRLAEFAGLYLTSATRAERLCAEIFDHWDSEHVTLDFSNVRTISPSFANTLLLNLLHRVRVAEFHERVRFLGASPHVQDAIDKAIDRHEKQGIDLTSYLPA